MQERDGLAQDAPEIPFPSPEDVVVLQSTVEALRQERDQLLRRLQLAEASTRERLQLAESRAREAAAQVEALKRAAQQVREHLESEFARVREEHGAAQLHARQWEKAAEGLRRRAAELETLLEATQLRVADLETENAVLSAEIERLRGELETTRHHWGELQARFDSLAQERLVDREAAERARQDFERMARNHAALLQELETAQRLATERAAHSESLTSSLHRAESRIQELEGAIADLRTEVELARAASEQAQRDATAQLARKEESWAQERDRLARALEEEQNRSASLERDLGAIRAQLCSLQVRSQLDAEQEEWLQEELRAARAELERERRIFEELAQRRQTEWTQEMEKLRRESAAEVATWQERLSAIQAASSRQEEELRRLHELLSASQAETAALTAVLGDREAELSALQSALRERERSQCEAEELVVALQSRTVRLEAELAAAREEMLCVRQALDDQREHVAAERRAWQRNTEELLAQLDEERRRGAASASELAQLQEQIHALQETLAKASVDAHVRGIASAQAQTHAASWETRARLVQQEYASLQARHDTGVEAAQAQLAALRALTEQLACERDQWRQHVSNLEAQLASSLEARAGLESEVAQRGEANRALQSELTSLRQALQAAEHSAQTWAQNLEQERDRAQQLVADQLAALEERERQIGSLASELERRSQEFRSLELALREAGEELERLRASAADADALRMQARSWEECLRQSEEATADLRAELVQALEALAEERKRSRDQEEQSVRLQEQVRELATELEHAQAARAEALTALDTARQHLETLQEQSVIILQSQEVLTQENRDLRAELERWRARWQQQEGVAQDIQRQRDEALARCCELEALQQRERTEHFKIRQQLDTERETLRNALEAARAQLAQLQAQLTFLQKEKGTRAGLPSTDLVELERERAELKTQVEKLSAVIRQLGQEREEQRVAALQTQASLSARLDELAAERGALTLRVAELETLANQLDRECERLRRERLPLEELRKYKAEIARLEARVEELERLRAEAAQNHSAVVGGYLTELTQRTETLQAKEAELGRLQRKLEELCTALEDTQAQLEAEREERTQVQAALDELRRATTASAARPAMKVADKTTDGKKPRVEEPAPLRLADSTAIAPTAAAAASSLAHCLETPQLTVVHLEENKECRERVQRLVRQRPHVRYLNTTDFGEVAKDGAVLLAVNLLNRAHDPIAALSRFVRAPHPCGIFAYCAEGKFGFLFGDATFFASPFDIDACTTWLLSSVGSVQRLLVASNSIEMTSELRTALAKIRCSTSVALDFRQAVDLLPLIQPEVVVLDLSLPRADGLRLISRLRNDEKTATIPLGVILPEHQRVAELRQNAARAAREGTLSLDVLVRTLAAELGLPVPEAFATVTNATHPGR